MVATRALTELTPELAALLLSKPHPKQRRVSKQVWEGYARAIREDRWRLVDDALLVVGVTHAGPDDPDGSMFNGAHRCAAVVSTRIAIPVWIDWDADPATFDLIDVGRKRNASQFVDKTFATARAAAARVIIWYDRRFDRPPAGVNMFFDMHEVLDEVERHNDTFEVVIPLATQTWEYTGLATGVTLAAYTIAFNLGHEAVIRDFVEGLIAPADRLPNDPARLLADRFRHQHHRARRRTAQDDWTVLVRALNLHIQGLRPGKLQMGEVWPRVGELEVEFNRRRQALRVARERANQPRDSHKAGAA